jgi:hypothetical protein
MTTLVAGLETIPFTIPILISFLLSLYTFHTLESYYFFVGATLLVACLAAHSADTSVHFYQTTRRHILKYNNLPTTLSLNYFLV